MSRPKLKHIVAEKLIEELTAISYQETKKSQIKFALRKYFKELNVDRFIVCDIEDL